jgi:hypothetical protein
MTGPNSSRPTRRSPGASVALGLVLGALTATVCVWSYWSEKYDEDLRFASGESDRLWRRVTKVEMQCRARKDETEEQLASALGFPWTPTTEWGPALDDFQKKCADRDGVLRTVSSEWPEHSLCEFTPLIEVHLRSLRTAVLTVKVAGRRVGGWDSGWPPNAVESE